MAAAVRLGLRAEVDDALRLALRALDLPRRHDLHAGRDADVRLDVVLQRPRLGAALGLPERRAQIAARLDDHLERVEAAVATHLEHVVRRELRLPGDQLLDLRREDVHTADDEHVVTAAGDARHAPHRASGPWSEARQVPRAVADHRQRFLSERGEHELPGAAIGQDVAGRGVDDLRVEVILPDREAILGLDALLRNAGPDHLGQPVDVDRVEAHPLLDLLAHAFGPWLGAEDPDPQ